MVLPPFLDQRCSAAIGNARAIAAQSEEGGTPRDRAEWGLRETKRGTVTVIVTVRMRFGATWRKSKGCSSQCLQPLATPRSTRRWTQNLAKFTLREGSTPSSATNKINNLESDPEAGSDGCLGSLSPRFRPAFCIFSSPISSVFGLSARWAQTYRDANEVL